MRRSTGSVTPDNAPPSNAKTETRNDPSPIAAMPTRKLKKNQRDNDAGTETPKEAAPSPPVSSRKRKNRRSENNAGSVTTEEASPSPAISRRKRKKDQRENETELPRARQTFLRKKRTQQSLWCWLLDEDDNPSTATEASPAGRATGKRKRKPGAAAKDEHNLYEIAPTFKEDKPSDDVNEHWMKMFRKLCKYKKKNDGSTDVVIYQAPSKQKKLGHWLMDQRTAYYRKNLHKSKIELLESIDVPLKKRITFHWMTMYERLLRYKEEHGNCNIPQKYHDYTLARWICTQRMNGVTTEQARLMEEIGFEWRPKETAWMNMYNELAEYRKKHGHTRVPRHCKEHSKLVRWVSAQRAKCEQEHRIDLLNELGFEWTLMQDQWMKMYDRLVAYKKKHGDTKVSQWGGDPQLGGWVLTQRKMYKNNSFQDNRRIELLNKIGFNWTGKRGLRDTPKF